jgi:hypothetical protein
VPIVQLRVCKRCRSLSLMGVDRRVEVVRTPAPADLMNDRPTPILPAAIAITRA